MAGAAGGRGEVSVDEYAEDAFSFRICFLVAVVGPDFFCEGEFGGCELAGDGGGHVVLLLSENLEGVREKGEGRG